MLAAVFEVYVQKEMPYVYAKSGKMPKQEKRSLFSYMHLPREKQRLEWNETTQPVSRMSRFHAFFSSRQSQKSKTQIN